MSGSKDKYLADMLAIQNELSAKKFREAGAGDILAGALARAGLKSIAPRLLQALDEIGLAPGRK